jgi:hypothetical protein
MGTSKTNPSGSPNSLSRGHYFFGDSLSKGQQNFVDLKNINLPKK